MATTLHIHPTAELAPRVLLPGDPGRALLLAQSLLQTPKMFNHNRGLWGYTGTAPDGAPLTIQSTGMGGPSAAIVIEELVRLGAEQIVRVGSCGALVDGFALGDPLVVEAAFATDGTSRALGAGELVAADAGLTTSLGAAAADEAGRSDDGAAADGDGMSHGPVRQGAVLTTDLFYDPAGEHATPPPRDALAVEMETATLFQLGALRGVATGCVLLVSDLLGSQHSRIEPEAMEAAAIAVGRIAVAALS
jgi:uridine phosphorylase